jgi:hypothetical protein
VDRIAELIAKGIENLSTEELVELEMLCHAETDERLDADLTDEVLADLETIAVTIEAVKAESTSRAEAAAERQRKRQELADRIKGTPEEDEEPEVEVEAEVEVDPASEDLPEIESADSPLVPASAETPGAEAVPVVASNTTTTANSGPPVISRVAARRPATHAPRPTPRVRQAAMVASANVPGVSQGSRLDTPKAMFDAFDAGASVVAGARKELQIPVITSRSEIPNELMLGRDAYVNAEKLRARTSPEALVASGGVCSPVPYRYDLPTWGDNARPVRDALARYGAQRAGVRTFIPPTIADVGAGIGQWTITNDENPTSPATKPCATIICDDDEVITKIYAITDCLKVGNFRDRWDPERVRAYIDLSGVYHSRYAESLNLKGIATGSKVVTHGQVLGTAQDVFTSLDQLFAGIRYRHRIARGQRFRVIGFEWVRDNLIADLIRTGPGDATLEERLVMAVGEVDRFFASHAANVTWSPDYENGRAVGQTGGPFAGVQGVGAVVGYPTKARFYVFLEGSWLFLDGGQLDLGVIRDSTLVGTNDMMIFSESFENVHYHGLPGESYVYDLDICANGGIASALDIDPCTSGS